MKCPNCNAQIHISPNTNILKCEYCDTELIINNNIPNSPQQTNIFPQRTNNFPQQTNNFPQYTGSVEEMKKWEKERNKYLIIQAVITFFLSIFMEINLTGIGVLLFFIAIAYSFVLPVHLINIKPISPTKQKNNKLIEFIKVYPAFVGAFWGGMLIILFILA